jgi:hypothetical protein
VEGYKKLLGEAKDQRLETLMNQTDAFLAQMGILVQKERETEGEEGKDDKVEEGSTSKKYYTAAHSIQEDVNTQPEMLVGMHYLSCLLSFFLSVLLIEVADHLCRWCIKRIPNDWSFLVGVFV